MCGQRITTLNLSTVVLWIHVIVPHRHKLCVVSPWLWCWIHVQFNRGVSSFYQTSQVSVKLSRASGCTAPWHHSIGIFFGFGRQLFVFSSVVWTALGHRNDNSEFSNWLTSLQRFVSDYLWRNCITFWEICLFTWCWELKIDITWSHFPNMSAADHKCLSLENCSPAGPLRAYKVVRSMVLVLMSSKHPN